jgi:hypothetical protein
MHNEVGDSAGSKRIAVKRRRETDPVWLEPAREGDRCAAVLETTRTAVRYCPRAAEYRVVWEGAPPHFLLGLFAEVADSQRFRRQTHVFDRLDSQLEGGGTRVVGQSRVEREQLSRHRLCVEMHAGPRSHAQGHAIDAFDVIHQQFQTSRGCVELGQFLGDKGTVDVDGGHDDAVTEPSEDVDGRGCKTAAALGLANAVRATAAWPLDRAR